MGEYKFMEFETLADLVEAYGNGQLDDNTPLFYDEENNVVYMEKTSDEDQNDSVESDSDDRYRFLLNLQQFVIEAANIIGIPIDLTM